MKRLILFLSLLFLIVILSITLCGYWLNYGRYETVDFSYLTGTNRIKVSTYNVNDDGNKKELCETRTINDAIKVKNITSQVQTYTHNWQYEQFSPPWTISFGRLAPVQISFYKNEVKEITLTIGYLDGFGYFLQQAGDRGRHLSVEELEEIIDLIEIDKEVVDSQNPCN